MRRRKVEELSDLISRKKLIENIKKFDFGSFFNDTEKEYIERTIIYIINLQQTAYSIDEVTEKLKSDAERWEDSGKEYKDRCEIAVGRGLRNAIEIVKHGGVSDDVCEWKMTDTKKLMTYEASCGNEDLYDNSYKYCPYCGKKILCKE